jgi:hypothetical protein
VHDPEGTGLRRPNRCTPARSRDASRVKGMARRGVRQAATRSASSRAIRLDRRVSGGNASGRSARRRAREHRTGSGRPTVSATMSSSRRGLLGHAGCLIARAICCSNAPPAPAQDQAPLGTKRNRSARAIRSSSRCRPAPACSPGCRSRISPRPALSFVPVPSPVSESFRSCTTLLRPSGRPIPSTDEGTREGIGTALPPRRPETAEQPTTEVTRNQRHRPVLRSPPKRHGGRSMRL